MKKIIQALGCLIVGASSLTAGVTVDITFANPSDTTVTATISGTATTAFMVSFDDWDYDAAAQWEWEDLNRDSGVSLLSTDGNFTNTPVTSSNAIASDGNSSVTVAHVDLVTNSGQDHFGFSFDSVPTWSGAEDNLTFSGSFDFQLPGGLTAGDLGIGTWSHDKAANGDIVRNWVPTLKVADMGLTLTVSQVPEPSTYAVIAGIFVAGWVFMRRRSLARV